jgi:hypothetical protein
MLKYIITHLLMICIVHAGDTSVHGEMVGIQRDNVGPDVQWGLYEVQGDGQKSAMVGFTPTQGVFVPANPLITTVTYGRPFSLQGRSYGLVQSVKLIRRMKWDEVKSLYPNTKLPLPQYWREFTHHDTTGTPFVVKGVVDPDNHRQVLVADNKRPILDIEKDKVKPVTQSTSDKTANTTTGDLKKTLDGLKVKYAEVEKVYADLEQKYKEHNANVAAFSDEVATVNALEESLLWDETKGGERKGVYDDGRVARIKLNKRDYDGRRVLAERKESLLNIRHGLTKNVAEIKHLREKVAKMRKETRSKLETAANLIKGTDAGNTIDIAAYEPPPFAYERTMFYTYMTGSAKGWYVSPLTGNQLPNADDFIEVVMYEPIAQW